MWKPLNRRTMLKGMLAGGVVTIGLPPFEAFFDGHGRAYAADGTFPRRFGLFFWGNGTLPERWTPPTTGADCSMHPFCAELGYTGNCCPAEDGMTFLDCCENRHCGNGRLDYDETGLDCGGKKCDQCAGGQGCHVDSDCASGTCKTVLEGKTYRSVCDTRAPTRARGTSSRPTSRRGSRGPGRAATAGSLGCGTTRCSARMTCTSSRT